MSLAILLTDHALAPLTAKPQRIDGYHESPLNDYGWRVRFGYRITQHGRPNSRAFGSNNPDADGIPTEVVIVDAVLVSENRRHELPLPLEFIPEDHLAEHRDDIEAELDEEQG